MKPVIAALFVLYVSTVSATESTPADSRKAVLVTGASSGIGRRIAEVLAEQGFYVYAGARKPEDIESLSELPYVSGIRLDVTRQD
ncbi:MAG: SDR family NAD(P)-dependent oxidoreductase, partial [Pseudomonadota bacterium]